MGSEPTYPAESFGYIEAAETNSAGSTTPPKSRSISREARSETAEQYLASGNFYWNSGIFLWRASTILDALAKFEPEMYAHLSAIEDVVRKRFFRDKHWNREFNAIVGKSIDYAVMERYDNVVVIEAPFPWDDVGSWQALSRLHEPDADGNTVVGSHIGIDTHGSIIHGEARSHNRYDRYRRSDRGANSRCNVGCSQAR